MSRHTRARVSARQEMLEWIAGIGAATAESLADRDGASVASARGRLAAAKREELIAVRRPLAAEPALYTLTAFGLRTLGRTGLSPGRVSNANALHLIACARAAAALERCYPDHRVVGERELRRIEGAAGAPIASAFLAGEAAGEPRVHRPDLVLWPIEPRGSQPVAVEVELAVKAPRRLVSICRAWARCREVAGVLYLAAPEAERALARAIEAADASEKVLVVPLDALPSREEPTAG
jgi:hypothetical protein